MSSRPCAIISGAGIAGLATAVRLGQTGWQPLIVERAPERRGDGYLINLAGDGLAAAERIGILPALRPHHLGLQGFTYFTQRGRRRFAIGNSAAQAMLGPDHLTLMRGDLEAAVYNAAGDHAEIKFGTRIVAVTQDHGGVSVILDDGTTLDGELLIGADGLHSGVRELVFTSESAVRSDLGTLVAAFFPGHSTDLVPERTAAMVLAPNRTVALIRLSPERTAALLTYRDADPAAELASDPRAALTRRFDDLGWLIPDLAGQLQRASTIYFDTVSQIALNRWCSGRVVLLGDAAWCLSLFAGAGAAMAMTSADLLARLLDERPDIPAALTEWEAELRPQVARRQQAARRNAAHFAPTSQLQIWLGSILVRLAALPAAAPLIRRRIRH